MEVSNGKAFAYPWYHLWRSLPFAAVLTGFAVLVTIIALNGHNPSSAWSKVGLVAMFGLGASYYLYMYLLMLWEPQTFNANELGLIGTPLLGGAMRLDWNQMRAVEFPRRSIYSTGEVMLIRGPQRKRMRVCSDLRGYEELKQVVLERTGNGGTRAGPADRQGGPKRKAGERLRK